MKSSLYLIFILVLVSSLSGGLLSLWNGVTEEPIRVYREKTFQQALRELLPDAKKFTKRSDDRGEYYIADGETERWIAFRADGNGFQGKIVILVGVTADLTKVVNIKILDHTETPGLGSRIIDDPFRSDHPGWFIDQFGDLPLLPDIVLVKNGKTKPENGVDAITGATISSRSVVKIVNQKINEMRSGEVR